MRKRLTTYNEVSTPLSHEINITAREAGNTGWKITRGPSGNTSVGLLLVVSEEYGKDAFDIYIVTKPYTEDDEGKGGNYYLLARNIKNTKNYLDRANAMMKDFMELIYQLVERVEKHTLLVYNGIPDIQMLKGLPIKLSLIASDEKGNPGKIKEYVEWEFKFHPDEVEKTYKKVQAILARNCIYMA